MTERVSAIILAGGQGARMDHENKGLVSFNGQPLIRSVIDCIAPQVDELIISANQNISTYQSFGYPVIEDGDENLGPLSGILSSSRYAKHALILVVPCDMPFLPTDLVKRMMKNFESQAISIFANNRLQPLVTIIRSETIKSIETYLNSGRRSVIGWLEEIEFSTMVWREEIANEGDIIRDKMHDRAFNNLNSKEDLLREDLLQEGLSKEGLAGTENNGKK